MLVPLYVCVVYSPTRVFCCMVCQLFGASCVVQGAPLCTEMTTAQPLESSRHYTTALHRTRGCVSKSACLDLMQVVEVR